MGFSAPAKSERGIPGTPGSSLAQISAIVSLLGARRGTASGLEGLGKAFERAALGGVFDSWVEPGPNLPISSRDLGRALGEPFGLIEALAGANGAGLTAALARRLPEIVDRLTPDGQLPPGGVELKALLACLRR